MYGLWILDLGPHGLNKSYKDVLMKSKIANSFDLSTIILLVVRYRMTYLCSLSINYNLPSDLTSYRPLVIELLMDASEVLVSREQNRAHKTDMVIGFNFKNRPQK